MDDKAWKRELKNIEKESNVSEKFSYYGRSHDTGISGPGGGVFANGWFSLVALVLSGGMFIAGLHMMRQAIVGLMCGNDPEFLMKGGTALVGFALIVAVASMAIAGAGLATRQGVIGSCIVLAFYVLPILYFIAQVVFGFSLGGSPSLPDMTPNPGSFGTC